MAKAIKEEKGFLSIKMNNKEAKSLGFGTPEGCICAECNGIIGIDTIGDSMYYVAVLNDVMCPYCYKQFIESSHYYPEDSAIEKRNFDFYAKKLSIE